MSTSIISFPSRSIIFKITFSVIFSLFLVSPVYSDGDGADGGGGTATASPPSRDDAISSMAGRVATGGTVSVGKGMGAVAEAVADTASGRGVAGVSVSETDDGFSVSADTPGETGGGYEGTPPTYPTDPTCTSAADIVVADLSFSRKNNPKEYLTSFDLDIGANYIPSILVVNAGCSDTNEGKVREDYRNQDPKGSNGTFPVRLQLDFDDDGVIDYDEVINSVGPLEAGETTIIAFPAFKANNDGDHSAVATADPHSMDKVGCTGGWGCVKETNETNKYNLDFAISLPWIDLGSFLVFESVTCNREDPGDALSIYCYLNARQASKPVDRTLYRDVESKVYEADYDYSDFVPGVYAGGPKSYSDWDIGLLWDGHKVDYSTCTGNRSDFDGKWHPWAIATGFDSSETRANVSFSKNLYDLGIDEPPADESHTYTITCKTTAGGTVSDTHILNGSGVIKPPESLINLEPNIGNKKVKTGDVLKSYPFSVKNTGELDVNSFTYAFSIAGEDVTTGDGSAAIPALKTGKTKNFDGAIAWTAPDTKMTLPIEVCITHPDMTGTKCASGKITVSPDVSDVPECRNKEDDEDIKDGLIDEEDPGCWTDPTDPTTYDPDDDDEFDTPPETSDPRCNDKKDNDGDGLIDEEDPGCWTDPTDPTTYDPDDNTEKDPPVETPKPECSNSEDDDGDGLKDALDPGCDGPKDDDESEDPTITASPTLVRYGEKTTVEWDPKGNTGCTFSDNLGITGVRGVPGSKSVTITAESVFTITCTDDSGSDRKASITVQALPLMYET